MSLPSYMAEPRAESQWSFVLRKKNLNTGMKNDKSVGIFGGNWRFFAKYLTLESKGLMDVPDIANDFEAYLIRKKKADKIVREDIETYVADKLWDVKLLNNLILNPIFVISAHCRSISRGDRTGLHEAIVKGLKFIYKQFIFDLDPILKLIPESLTQEEKNTKVESWALDLAKKAAPEFAPIIDDFFNNKQEEFTGKVQNDILQSLGKLEIVNTPPELLGE